ncbi:MAG: hypothetical protein N3J91_00140 [Verrucomicrobiae bacterium]|nr:hypothetical protein [Verrucomicrobiae bacterium]
MKMAVQLMGWGAWCRGLLVLALLGSLLTVQAAELKLEIVLIWGSNEEKSPDPTHKPLTGEMAKRLSKVFKWKHYFEVNKINETIPNRGTKKIRVSPKCDIEITELEGSSVEVKLYGEGKLINKSVKQLAKGEYFVLAGEDKNETAWFIMITLLEEKR